jgi:hypothetical protein
MSSLIQQVQVLEDLLQKLYLKVENMKKLQSEDTNTIEKLNKEIKLLNQKNFEKL